MATYLGYVTGGKTTKAEGGGERDHTQFYVQRELEALGIDAWVGRKVTFIRRGKKRTPEPIVTPALPNYIFMDMVPEQLMAAKDVKYLASTFTFIPIGELAGVARFKSAVEAAFIAAQRVDANSRASVAEYKHGASLNVVSGPFSDMLVRFERLVKSPDVDWPRVEVTIEGLGGKGRLDPLDVRKVG
jgi:transcription antitermination factor NusG